MVPFAADQSCKKVWIDLFDWFFNTLQGKRKALVHHTTWGLLAISKHSGIFYIVEAWGASYCEQRGCGTWIDSTLYNNVEKRFQSKGRTDTLQKPFKCLVCDSLFVLMETWKIVTLSFQVCLPNTSAILVQSRPFQCVCICVGQADHNEHVRKSGVCNMLWLCPHWRRGSAHWFTFNKQHP